MKRNTFFWLAYSDFMTSLFFVFFALFAAYFMSLRDSDEKVFELENDLRVSSSRLDSLAGVLSLVSMDKDSLLRDNARLRELLFYDGIVEGLSGKGFRYLGSCGKFVFKSLEGREIFSFDYDAGKNLQRVRGVKSGERSVLKMGRVLSDFMKNLSEHRRDLSYLLILEGVAPGEQVWEGDKRAYQLGFSMVHKLYHKWYQNDIKFDRRYCRVLLCGALSNNACSDGDVSVSRIFVWVVPIKN